MASFMNALGSVSRRGQWRFRKVFRGSDPSGRLDVSDAGLVDFSTASDLVLTVAPRAWIGRGPWCWGGLDGCHGEPAPILSASLAAGTLATFNPGIVEAVFPVGTLLAIPPGLYDVRVTVTVDGETAEILNEPIEFA